MYICCSFINLLSFYFFSFFLFDRHYTLSVEVKTLPGKIRIHILQYMNIYLKYILLDGENNRGTSG